jgi:hypothetical protein
LPSTPPSLLLLPPPLLQAAARTTVAPRIRRQAARFMIASSRFAADRHPIGFA